MKFKILLFFFLTTSLLSFSQPEIEWQKSLGGSNLDEARSIRQTLDGGYIVAGHSESNDGDVTGNHGNRDYWVVKLTETGAIEWEKTLGGSDNDWARSVIQTSDGGYIVAGGSWSNDGDVIGSHGEQDVWIVKLTPTGTIDWQKTYGGSNGEWANSIYQTSDGGYIFAGFSISIDGDVTGNHGSTDYWIVKITETGSLEWQKSLGGSMWERANSIQQTIDGGYIVAGGSPSIDGDITGNHGAHDYWIVKLTSNGVIEWQKSLGGSSEDSANSIQEIIGGGYIVSGFSYSNDGDVTGNNGDYDFWIIKLNTTGGIVWQESFGGSNVDGGGQIQQTLDGGFIIEGNTYSNDGDVNGNQGEGDFWIIKISETGDLNWQKTLGGSGYEIPYSIQQTIDGGFIVAGISESNDGDVSGNHGEGDFWIVKLSSYLGVNDNNFNTALLYPNPTNGVININTDDIKAVTFFNSLGKQSYFKELSGKSYTNIDVSHLARGVYTVVISTSNQQLVKNLIIK